MNELFLIAAIAGERVAVPAADIHSVVEIDRIISVPRAAAHVAGLAAMRSRVLTVIDCNVALGLAGPSNGKSRQAVVVEVDGHSYALLLDSVEDVLECLGIPETGTPLAPIWARVTTGIVEVGEALLPVLDVHTLIAGPAVAAA